MQTKVSVGKEDSGKSIRLGVGDLLEVGLPETDARAAWRVEVDTEVLTPIASPTNTQAVWVLDEGDQLHVRTFRAARVGRAALKMTYNRIETGQEIDSFALEAVVGNPPKPKPIRQPLPASQLMVVLFQIFLLAAAGCVLMFRFLTIIASVLTEQAKVADQVWFAVGPADLLLAILGTVVMGAVAGYALLRIVAMFATRLR